MTDDQHVERVLIAAGERQRAAAPDAAAARQALQRVDDPRSVELVDDTGGPRRWPVALILAAAAAVAVAVIAAGNSGVDTIRDVPATQPDVTAPRSDPISAPSTSEAPNPPEQDIPVETTELVLGDPIALEFEGLPLTDVAVSPTADRIAVNRNDEICILWTMPPSSATEERCYPTSASIGSGSITWSPDGTTLVFHQSVFFPAEEPDLLELDLASGELSVLTDDGVSVARIDGGAGDVDVAPIFTEDGTLYFFRFGFDDGIQSEVYRYGTDGEVTATDLSFDRVPLTGRRSAGSNTIVTFLSKGLDDTMLVSIDVVDGTSRSIPFEVPSIPVPQLADVARDRALLVSPYETVADGFEMSIADFATGNVVPIDVSEFGGSSKRLVGGGLSPDGNGVALIVADRDAPDGHLLLAADIATDGSIGPLTVLATGSEFAPNDGDQTIRPAGLGRFGEIVWTDTALIYTLGPDQIVTLPLL